MDDLLEWIKANAKDDADISEAEKLVSSYSEVTPERAAELAKDKEMKRVIDAEISRAVERHDERFREEKLPKILDEERDKIRREVNPEETQEQKAVRELQEKLANMEQEKSKVERREQLRQKAKELGVDEIGLSPDDVDAFADLGDSAPEVLESFIDRTKKAWNDSLDREVKKRYSNGKPPQGGDSKGVEQMSVDEQMAYARRGDKERDEVMQFAKQKQKQGAN